MAAIATVDAARWDIKAQAAQTPLYQLLRGRSRDSIRTYGLIDSLRSKPPPWTGLGNRSLHPFWLEDVTVAETRTRSALSANTQSWAAALHIDATHHAFGIQEYMQHTGPSSTRGTPPPTAYASRGSVQGRGSGLTRAAAEKYPVPAGISPGEPAP